MDLQTQTCDVLAAGSGARGFAAAQKSGGTLRAVVSTNPPSASIHEELMIAAVAPFMAVFNNLMQFDQGKSRNSTMVEPNWQPQDSRWHAGLALE
jgi:hypothetical protein